MLCYFDVAIVWPGLTEEKALVQGATFLIFSCVIFYATPELTGCLEGATRATTIGISFLFKNPLHLSILTLKSRQTVKIVNSLPWQDKPNLRCDWLPISFFRELIY